jgi:ankyrin repeat protein
MDESFVNDLLRYYDKHVPYPCSKEIKSKGFNKLMYLLVTFPNRIELLIKYIIDHPEQINEQNNEGWTPLMIVAQNGRQYDPQILKSLIAHGSNLDIRNDLRQTASILALKSNSDSNLATFKILLEAERYGFKTNSGIKIIIETRDKY